MIINEYNRRSDVLKYAYQEGDLLGHIATNQAQATSDRGNGSVDDIKKMRWIQETLLKG